MAEKILLLKLITDLKQPVSSIQELRKRITSLTKALKQLPDEGTPAFDEMAKTISGKLGISIDQAKKKMQGFGKEATAEIQKGNEQLSAFNKNLRKVTPASNSINEMRARVKALAKEVDNLDVNTKSFANKNKELRELNKELIKIEQTSARGGRNVGNYASAFDGFKGSFKNIAKTATSMIGLSSAAALVGTTLVKSIKSIIAFDDQVADLQKVVGGTSEEARKLANSVAAIDTRTSVDQLLELAVAGGRLNLKGQELITFTESVDKAFVALGDSLPGSAEEIGLTLGKIASNFNVDQDFTIGVAIEKVGSALNELGAKSKATEGSIVDFINRLSGVAVQSGISISQVASLGALFNETGQSIEVASTTLNTLIPSLAENKEAFAAMTNTTLPEFSKMLEEDAFGALIKVAEGAKSQKGGIEGLQETLQNYGVESARAASIVGILSDNTDRLTQLQEIANNGYEKGTSLADEFALKNSTLAARLERVGNKWDAFIKSLDSGNGIISKAVKGLTDMAGGFIDLFSEINEGASLEYIFSGEDGANINKEIDAVKNNIAELSKTAGGFNQVFEQGLDVDLTAALEKKFGADDASRLAGEFIGSLTETIKKDNTTGEAINEALNGKDKTVEVDVEPKIPPNSIKGIKDQLEALNKQKVILDPDTKAFTEVDQQIKILDQSLKQLTTSQKEEAKLVEGSIAFLEDQLKVFKQQLKEAPQDLQLLSELSAQVDEVETKLAEAKSLQKTIQDIASAPTGTVAPLPTIGPAPVSTLQDQEFNADGIVDFEEINKRRLEDRQATIEKEKQIELNAASQTATSLEELSKAKSKIEIDTKIKEIQAKLELDKLSANQRLALEAELNEAKLQQGDEAAKKQLEKEKELRAKLKEIAINAVNSLSGAILSLQRQEDEAKTSAAVEEIESKYNREAEAAQGNSELIKQIEEKKAAEIEEIERAAFEREKKRKKAEIFIASALAVIQAFAQLGPIAGGIASAVIAATTAIQIAAVNKQKYEKGGLFTDGNRKGAKGGIALTGRRHGSGGNPVLDGRSGKVIGETEVGEPWINRRSAAIFYDLLSSINSYKGYGVKFPGARRVDLDKLKGVPKYKKNRYDRGGMFRINPSFQKLEAGGIITAQDRISENEDTRMSLAIVDAVNKNTTAVVEAISSLSSTSDDLLRAAKLLQDEEAAS